MTPRRTIWEERHRGALAPGDAEPSVVEMLPLLTRGPVLDIAAGTGRNAIALARAGIRVVAADFSAPGLTLLAGIAAARGSAISADARGSRRVVSFPPCHFDVVVNVTYLDRPLIRA